MPVADRPRTTVIGACLEGWRRVWRAPAITAGVLVATLAAALPVAVVMRDLLASHLGDSLQAETAAGGWNEAWASEFSQQADGIGRTFTHEILGFGGTMAIASDLIDRVALSPGLAASVAVYIGLWMFLSGGIIDRFARDRAVRAPAFFSSCGTVFFRFLRMGLVIGPLYWALFAWVHPLLFTRVYDHFTRDMTAERSAVALRIGLYALFLFAVMLVGLLADYAKIRAVVEDRRSALSALAASARFIRRRPWRTGGVVLLNVVVLALVVRLWMDLAPSASAAPWLAFLLAQVYLLLRLAAKLGWLASEVVFFQGELAHAGYTATALPVWPDSPAAETIRR